MKATSPYLNRPLRSELEVELLAALDNLLGEFMSRMTLIDACDWTPEEDAAEEQAHAVIAKARGE